jgi:hypothetical protein
MNLMINQLIDTGREEGLLITSSSASKNNISMHESTTGGS